MVGRVVAVCSLFQNVWKRKEGENRGRGRLRRQYLKVK